MLQELINSTLIHQNQSLNQKTAL
ncbi:MAG: hypothetical protein RJB13_1787, partial [Pseudomonadota bacterium]